MALVGGEVQALSEVDGECCALVRDADNWLYDPLDDSWRAMARERTLAGKVVWTGSEMLSFCHASGSGGPGEPPPFTRAWSPATNDWSSRLASPPSCDGSCWLGGVLVWTGSEVLAYAGPQATGTNPRRIPFAAYDPLLDYWREPPLPDGDTSAIRTAAWVGDRLVVAEYQEECTVRGYAPETDSWRDLGTTGFPCLERGCAMYGAGSDPLALCGHEEEPITGAVYDRAMDSWRPTAKLNAPEVTSASYRPVWTGSEMIFWERTRDGSIGLSYSPTRDAWRTIDADGIARVGYAAVWTGSEMIVWGGHDGDHPKGGGPAPYRLHDTGFVLRPGDCP